MQNAFNRVTLTSLWLLPFGRPCTMCAVTNFDVHIVDILTNANGCGYVILHINIH